MDKKEITMEKFIVYVEEMEALKELSNEEMGIFFRAMIRYAKTGCIPNLPEKMLFAFRFVISHIERDAKKYKEISEKRRNAGKRGGDAKWGKRDDALRSAENLHRESVPNVYSPYKKDNINGDLVEAEIHSDFCGDNSAIETNKPTSAEREPVRSFGEKSEWIQLSGEKDEVIKQMPSKSEAVDSLNERNEVIQQLLAQIEINRQAYALKNEKQNDCSPSVEKMGVMEETSFSKPIPTERNMPDSKPSYTERNVSERIIEENTAHRIHDINDDMGNRDKKLRNSPKSVSERFAEFWEKYPQKKNRWSAENAYMSLNIDEETHRVIMEAVERQKRTDQWKREGGRYIPYPARWLLEHRWEDVVETEKASDSSGITAESFDTDEFYMAALRKSGWK
jgi:hypothetical protein